MNGAEALLELFRTQGTDYIFCSPIAAWAPLWEALAKRQATTNIESPRYLNCRHEILAVGLASGYYKATGRPQVGAAPDGARRAARRDGASFGLPRTHSNGHRRARHADPWRSARARSGARMADVAGRSGRAGAQQRDRDQVGEGGEDRQRSCRRCPPRLVLCRERAARPDTARRAVRYPDEPGRSSRAADKAKASPLVAPTESLRRSPTC